MPVRHKCFLSYHHEDCPAVEHFLDLFDGCFIHRGIAMPEDVIDSNDPDYVMRRIRELYLDDSTLTIVLIGPHTWSRRYVDWEVQASLRRSQFGPLPNGLLAIQLWEDCRDLPDRVLFNVDSGYAGFWRYPKTNLELEDIVEEAYIARTEKTHLIQNPQESYCYNRQC
jgi:hypothetical protein